MGHNLYSVLSVCYVDLIRMRFGIDLDVCFPRFFSVDQSETGNIIRKLMAAYISRWRLRTRLISYR
jgi:hypothetical protein